MALNSMIPNVKKPENCLRLILATVLFVSIFKMPQPYLLLITILCWIGLYFIRVIEKEKQLP